MKAASKTSAFDINKQITTRRPNVGQDLVEADLVGINKRLYTALARENDRSTIDTDR